MTLAQKMPRHDIRMMLHHREDNLVTRFHARRSPGIRHHIDALGRARIEDNLVLRSRADKARNDPANSFIPLSRNIAKVMQPTVNIGVFFSIAARDCINHNLRLLRRSTIVQIHQRLAIHLA